MNITKVFETMSDPDTHAETDHIPENDDIPIGPGTVKYLKSSKTMNNKDLQKFAIPTNPEGRVKVVSYFPETPTDFLKVILFKPSQNIKTLSQY